MTFSNFLKVRWKIDRVSEVVQRLQKLQRLTKQQAIESSQVDNRTEANCDGTKGVMLYKGKRIKIITSTLRKVLDLKEKPLSKDLLEDVI